MLNPKLHLIDGVWWVDWTPDPTAEGYLITTPKGAGRTFDPGRTTSKVGSYPSAPVVTVEVLDVTRRSKETASVPGTPPTDPPPAGVVLWDGRFPPDGPMAVPSSGGYQDRPGGWDRLHVQGQATFSLFDDPAGRSSRITLPPDSGLNRAELQEVLPNMALGTREFYGLRYRFPTGWKQPSSWGSMIAQFRYPYLKYHGIGLVGEDNWVRLALNTGYIDWGSKAPSADATPVFENQSNHEACPSSRFALGVWHYFVVEILWTTVRRPGETTCRVWHRREGESSWVRTVELVGTPTQQWGKGIDYSRPDKWAGMNVDGSAMYGGVPHECFDKFGFYRGASNDTLTLESGGPVKTTTFDLAASMMEAK